MPISCETCREALHSHLADFIAPKSGEAPVLATAPIQESAPEGAALSSTRRSEIEAHLTQCADCARELALLRGVTVELHSLPAVPAPLDLRARIQAQIASEVQAAPQPVATRATANQKRNSAASWFGLWRDFWRRSARVAWAGAALTGLLLLLAIQTNLPLPTSQSGSFTAPESSPPAAMIPGSPQPPQTTIRPIPGRNAPRSTAQQSTKRNSTDRGESARQSDQAQVLRDTSPSQQSAPPTSAQPQLKASTRAPSTREQITTAEAREPQSRSDATAPSTATPAIRPGKEPGQSNVEVGADSRTKNSACCRQRTADTRGGDFRSP
jgi:hypothetical protein